MSPHQSGRRRYAERAAAETATTAPAVGQQRASDKRIQISAADAERLIEREATAHTPGPWTYSDDERGYSIHHVHDDHSGRVVAKTHERFSDDEANARLIAAAPDLLAALTDILRETAGGAHGCAGAFIARACNAIAKAKGATP